MPSYSKGKTTKVTSSVSENRYLTFDIFGHVLTARQTTGSTNYDTTYTYNLSGALIEETYPSGRMVKNTLDANGDLSAVESKPSGGSYTARANTFVYNAAGAATSFKFGSNKYENFAYNNRMQVTQIGLGTSTSDTSLLKLEYKYNTTGNADNNGSMLEQKITVPTVGGNTGFNATQTYAYDALNRLSSATESISSTQTWKQEFSYDRYGNKNFVTGSGHTTTLGSCTTAVCNPSFDAATNRFASGQSYTYDANGAITVESTGMQYILDAENRQIEVKNASNVSLAEYSYDGDGKRVRKVTATTSAQLVTHFVYDAGGTLIEEWMTTVPLEKGGQPTVTTTSYIYAGSRLISTETSSGTTYVTLDHLGSTRVTTDGSGNVTSRKDFMSFGEEAISTERNAGLGYTPPPVRKDYTGYEKEVESGLQFAQARFQNPIHGRFTSVDPLTASASIKNPQSFNRYTYVLNSPYKFVDPLGLLSEHTTGACGTRCPGSDGGVDGSAFRGRDTTYDSLETISELVSGFMNWLRAGTLALNAADRAANLSPYSVSVKFNPTRYRYVDVDGEQAADAAGRAGQAVTDATKKDRVSIPCGDNGGGCTVPDYHINRDTKGNFTITVSLTIYLPRWTGYSKADSLYKGIWDKFVSETRTHEEIHVKIYHLLRPFIGLTTNARSITGLKADLRYQNAKNAVQAIHVAFDDLDVLERHNGLRIFPWSK